MLAKAWLIATAAVVGACATGETAGVDDDGAGGHDVGGHTADGGNGVGAGVPAHCNNGVLDPGEACDGAELDGQSCQTLGFQFGALNCINCVVDASQCFSQTCGNGVTETGEQCDGAALNGQTCQSLGFNGGTLSCDAQCMFQGCSDNFVDDFEGGVFGAGWTTGGAAPWLVSGNMPHMGAACAESGNIGDSQISTLSRTLTFGPAGSISFWHAQSTESGYDYLRFYVDGVMQGQWDGIMGWTQNTFNVPAGVHTLEWRYEKDGSLSSGADAVYIDDIAAADGF